MFTSLILDSENYQETLNQSEATNALIINSRKEFTFTNSIDHDKETIFERGIFKLCREYADGLNFLCITDNGGIRYFNQDNVLVKPIKYANTSKDRVMMILILYRYISNSRDRYISFTNFRKI